MPEAHAVGQPSGGNTAAPPAPDAKPVAAFDRYSSGAAFNDPLLWQIAAGLGLASGAIGGAYEYMAPDDPDETPSQRRMRALRSALVSGGAGALLGIGGKATVDLLSDPEGIRDQKPGTADSLFSWAKGPWGRSMMGGAAGYGLIDRWRLHNTEDNRAKRISLLDQVATKMNDGAARSSKGKVAIYKNRMHQTLDAQGNVVRQPWVGKDLDTSRLDKAYLRATGTHMDTDLRAELRRYGYDVPVFERGLRGTDALKAHSKATLGIARRNVGGLGGALAGLAFPHLANLFTSGE